MIESETGHDIVGRDVGGVLVERHRYPPGPAGVLPPHVHDEYQVCFSVDFVGEYRLGAAVHDVPVGSLCVIHPGEVHAARDPVDRHGTATYLVAYLPTDRLTRAVADIGPTSDVLTFPTPVFSDPQLAAEFVALHVSAMDDAPPLETDERLLAMAAVLCLRHGDRRRDPPRIGREERAVALARSFLHTYPHEQVTLADLARVSGLSPFRLTRAFRAEVGLPPHAYHLALRIEQAKKLLVAGRPAAHTAAEVGFFDQSHLTRHFSRLVGATPGRYGRQGKNVQAFSDTKDY